LSRGRLQPDPSVGRSVLIAARLRKRRRRRIRRTTGPADVREGVADGWTEKALLAISADIYGVVMMTDTRIPTPPRDVPEEEVGVLPF
jgi:hypothetical protein